MSIPRSARDGVYTRLAELQASGEAAALCTVTKTTGSVPRRAGAKMLVFPGGRTEDTIGGGEMEARVIAEALAALSDGRPRTLKFSLTDPARGDPGLCGGTMEVFVEPINPEPTLLIIGAGHVGKALAQLADFLGYRVLVSDDRPELCNPENIPHGDAFYPVTIAELPKHVAINSQTYVALTTRNAQIDIDGLPALLDSPTAYVGVIGSRRRWAEARKKMETAGVPAAKLDRVRSPMGLELKAETPEEIALSIMSEIVMLRRGGTGSTMN
ncbi:MAG: XdhC family protein [Chloroflexi bacterium]|nr:XdhC family protein [Chloroflexota bacterium]